MAALLLLPSFFVAGQTGAVGSQAHAVAASPTQQIPSPAKPSSLSSYRISGPADPTMPVLVSVVIPLRNLGTLSSLVKQYSDPSSSNYRHFLNYSQVSQMFLPTQAQYDSVLNYLTASGFKVELSALNSMIVVQGTASAGEPVPRAEGRDAHQRHLLLL